jgi:hypothetical protein
LLAEIVFARVLLHLPWTREAEVGALLVIGCMVGALTWVLRTQPGEFTVGLEMERAE